MTQKFLKSLPLASTLSPASLIFLSLTILLCVFPIIIGILWNKSIIAILISLVFISCGDRFYRVVVPQGNLVTDEMIQQLEVGMTEAQVISLWELL